MEWHVYPRTVFIFKWMICCIYWRIMLLSEGQGQRWEGGRKFWPSNVPSTTILNKVLFIRSCYKLSFTFTERIVAFSIQDISIYVTSYGRIANLSRQHNQRIFFADWLFYSGVKLGTISIPHHYLVGRHNIIKCINITMKFCFV